jgi:tRNA-specific adenosine deaminase 1
MIGFGFADNLIMIVAGDMIDKSLGVVLGISTLAAAGLGNLISDIAGLGVGDMIERHAERFLGPDRLPLSAAQSSSQAAKFTRVGGAIVGVTIGCLLGMFPLLFLDDRKETYFSDEELELYQSFQPYGVSPQPAQAPENSISGCWNCDPFTVYLSTRSPLFASDMAKSQFSTSCSAASPNGAMKSASSGHDSTHTSHPVQSIVARLIE